MTYRSFRRRMSEATAAHNWLEGSPSCWAWRSSPSPSCACGVRCDRERRRRGGAPGEPVTVGFLEVTRGFAMVLFAFFDFIAFGVGWFLSGDTVEGMVRPRQGASQGSQL
jgi:hypothetical protein